MAKAVGMGYSDMRRLSTSLHSNCDRAIALYRIVKASCSNVCSSDLLIETSLLNALELFLVRRLDLSLILGLQIRIHVLFNVSAADQSDYV